jgi:hypothetical protein
VFSILGYLTRLRLIGFTARFRIIAQRKVTSISLSTHMLPRQAWINITTGWFTDGMPDLNQENPLVSRYLIQNAMWWVETANLDGIRLDTFPYVDRAFWHDFHAALHSTYPHLTTVGEIFHRDPEVTSFFAGGEPHNGIDTGLIRRSTFPSILRCVMF